MNWITEKNMDELIQIKAAREGNEEAFKSLFDENRQKIFLLAFKYVRNREDAEDILQETFIKAFHSLDKFKMEEHTSFSSWLFRIGINTSIDLIRKNKKMKTTDSDSDQLVGLASSDTAYDPEHVHLLEDTRQKIQEALNALTSKQRMIFILRHYQNMNTKEIAEYMNCSQGSIKKQLFRAVTTVKIHFKKLIPEKTYEMQEI